MQTLVSIGGGWFDPHSTYNDDAIQLQEREQRLAAEEFLAQKLLTANYRHVAEVSGTLLTHDQLVQLRLALELSDEEILAAFVAANKEYELGLVLELSTHRPIPNGTKRCPVYVKFERVSE